MKLSKNTFSILKNFSSLNSNILVKEGNVLKTLTPAKNVMAEATVEEDFATQFGIWDLGKFLGTISLFSDPDFEFEEGYVSIKGSNNSLIKYFYSEPSLLTVPTKEIDMPDTVVSFGWKQDIFNDLLFFSSPIFVSTILMMVSSLKFWIKLIELLTRTRLSWEMLYMMSLLPLNITSR